MSTQKRTSCISTLVPSGVGVGRTFQRSLGPPTEYEKITYEGRCICQSKELGPGYMGSGPLEGHVAQMRDPESWVHSCADEWYRAGTERARSTLTLLSRVAVWMVLEALAREARRYAGGDLDDLRRVFLATALADGVLRVDWGRP